jgi:hypothetical protein
VVFCVKGKQTPTQRSIGLCVKGKRTPTRRSTFCVKGKQTTTQRSRGLLRERETDTNSEEANWPLLERETRVSKVGETL